MTKKQHGDAEAAAFDAAFDELVAKGYIKAVGVDARGDSLYRLAARGRNRTHAQHQPVGRDSLESERELCQRLEECKLLLVDCEEHDVSPTREVSVNFGYLAPNRENTVALAQDLEGRYPAHASEVAGEWGVDVHMHEIPFAFVSSQFLEWVRQMFLAGQRHGCLLTNVGIGAA